MSPPPLRPPPYLINNLPDLCCTLKAISTSKRTQQGITSERLHAMATVLSSENGMHGLRLMHAAV